MSQNAVIARALAALGHEVRLAIYRLLVRTAEEALKGGEIAAHLQMPASTLAHHLSTLVAPRWVIGQYPMSSGCGYGPCPPPPSTPASRSAAISASS